VGGCNPRSRQGQRLTEKIDDLFGRYVMDRQRETHLAVQGQSNTPGAAAPIELF
jgi:hypothetical protein